MLRDIPVRKVEGVGVAIAPIESLVGESHLEVFLINFKDEPIEHVLVASRGYGERDGELVETTTLRHYYEQVPPKAVCKVENIYEELADINHEFWVSFTFDDFLYDRRYTFVRGAISDNFFGALPMLGRKGVMIA